MTHFHRAFPSQFGNLVLLTLPLVSGVPAASQSCTANAYNTQGTCSPGITCVYSSNCNSTVASPCPTGQSCVLVNAAGVGVCVTGTTTCNATVSNPCGTDTGLTCGYINSSNVGLCVSSCDSNNPCPSGQTCVNSACIVTGTCSCQYPGCSPSAVPARTFSFTNNCSYPVYVGAFGSTPAPNSGVGSCTTNADCGVDQFCASNGDCTYVPINGSANVLSSTSCTVNGNCTASSPSCTTSSDTCLCVSGACSTYCSSATNQCATVPTNGNGFLLASGQSSSVSVPSDWSGDIWPRTGCPDFSVCQPAAAACSQNSDCCTNDCAPGGPSLGSCTNNDTCPPTQTCQAGQCYANTCQPAVGACLTGDCAGELYCALSADAPSTLAEFTLQPFATSAGAGGTCTGTGQSTCPLGQMCLGSTCVTPTADTYDLSNINGPNVPTQISPTANTTLTGVLPGVSCTSNSDCYQAQGGNAQFVCNTATNQCIQPYNCGSPGCSTTTSCASLSVSSWTFTLQTTGSPCSSSTTCPTGQTCQSGACATACTGGPNSQGTCPNTWQTCSAGVCVTSYAPQMQAVAPFQCGQTPCSECVSGTCTLTACTSNSDCTAPQVCGIAEVAAAAGAQLNPQPAQPWIQVCGQPLSGAYFSAGAVCSNITTLGPPLNCGSGNPTTNANLYGCTGIGSCYTPGANTSCCGCASWSPGGPFNSASSLCQQTNSAWTANAEVPAAISHLAVPTAYSFPYDDEVSTFTCSGQSSTQQVNYTITYCPSGSPGAVPGEAVKGRIHR